MPDRETVYDRDRERSIRSHLGTIRGLIAAEVEDASTALVADLNTATEGEDPVSIQMMVQHVRHIEFLFSSDRENAGDLLRTIIASAFDSGAAAAYRLHLDAIIAWECENRRADR